MKHQTIWVMMIIMAISDDMVRSAKAASEAPALNVAEAKQRLSEIIGRVAYGGASFVITRRGKPMAKLVPIDTTPPPPHLADVKGWLDAGDPFFTSIDRIVSSRSRRVPRALKKKRAASRSRT